MKNIAKVIGFICLLFIVLRGVYSVLSWKDTSGEYISVTEQLKYTPRNSIDVVFAGSSHVYSGIYPAVLWNDFGIAAFDMSVSEQDKNATYYGLKQLFKRQKPKVVCVEMYGLMFDEHKKTGDLYRNLLSVSSPDLVYKMARESVGKEEAISFVTRWPIVHTRYKEVKKNDFVKLGINNYARGEVVKSGIEKGRVSADIIDLTDSVALSDSNRKWLDSLVELSEKEGFSLVFFMTPYDQSPEERMIENGAKKYAEEKNIPYVDFKMIMDDLGFVPDEDMGDVWHCNTKGAYKLSHYFGEYLSDGMSNDRHLNDRGYEQWEEDYVHYRHIISLERLAAAERNQELIERIMETEDITVVFSLEGDFAMAVPYLEMLGIEADDCISGGKWIMQRGQIRKIMDNVPGESHFIPLNRYDGITAQYSTDGNFLINVLINSEGVNYFGNGLNIIVYDDFDECFVGNFGIGN